MAVYVKTKKGTYGLTKEEFVNYMHNLWERAQARKQARADIMGMIKEEKGSKK